MVKVGKLWGDGRFSSLPPYSKLIYLYLVTHPSISTLGVLELTKERLLIDLGLQDFDQLVEYGQVLHEEGYIVWVTKAGLQVFIIKQHFLSLSKSKLNIRKAIDEGKKSRYREQLLDIYEPQDFRPTMAFTPPTPQQVTDHALSLGYVVNGKTFVDYYASNDWYNKNNKKVRSWKLTLEKVWCREENKLTLVPDAPEGYEYFHITLENGDRISPEGWKNDRPTHSDFLHAELLNEEYSRCITKQRKNI
ncbi:MAG: hypothetical protein WBA57_04120 [Elainellaceae cyanobacterium]